MNEFFTWQTLVSLSGATSATVIITQFVKGYLSRIPTQIVSYAIALVILAVGTAATAGAAPWDVWALIPLNAVVVSLSSNGAFSAIISLKSGSHSKK